MIRKMIKEHYFVFFLALLAGVMLVAPQIFFVFDDAYQGIHMLGTDAESHYLARMNDVYDGSLSLGNVFLEDKDRPYMQAPLGEIIVAWIGKTIGFSAPNMNVASKFLFPPLIFILLYAFVYKLFADKKIAVLAACISFFGSNLFSLTRGPQDIVGLLSFSSSAGSFLTYARPINPQISGLFLIASLLFLFLAVNGNGTNNKKRIISAGILSGLSIYVYIYTWSFLAIFIGIYLLYFLYRKDGKKIKDFLKIIIIHILITVPYWMNFFEAKANSAYADTVIRFGLASGHLPVFSFWLAALLLALVFLWPKSYGRSANFLFFMVSALWIAINQQIITGQVIQQAHYHWYITKPLAVSIIVSALFVYFLGMLMKNNKMRIIVISVAVVMLFYNGILIQSSAYKKNYEQAVETQRFHDVFVYLNKNYDNPKIIWSQNGELATFLAGYTRHNAANSHYGLYYLVEKDYLVKRLFFEYKLREVKPREIGEVLEKERRYVSDRLFGIYYREKFGDKAFIPDEILAKLANDYEDFYNTGWSDAMKGLGIDLIVHDKKNEPELVYEDIPILQEVEKIGDGFVLYSFNLEH